MSHSLILVLNCGSSSIKFALIDVAQSAQKMNGLLQCIGNSEAHLQWKYQDQKHEEALPEIHYSAAIEHIVHLIQKLGLHDHIVAVGHRVVHGGEAFQASTVIDGKVLTAIESCNHLAPLHNPANVIGIKNAQKAYPDLPQVAVFDTAFHQTMPNYAFTYAVPLEWYKKFGVRRYGFHGTSHRFVTSEAAQRIGKPLEQCSFISAHLGNGCSITAVKNGKSVDTSMGLTPLEGLVMGTRSGDIDPSVHAYMAEQLHCNVQEITNMLNRKSGLLGLSEVSADMRQIMQASDEGNEHARLAIDVFCYRLAKYVMAYMVPLQKLDALIFTGGIGENAKDIRAKTIDWLSALNFHLDASRNDTHGAKHQGLITTDNSTPAYVIPTNEELLIAQDTLALINK